jgi:hypothetical protein
MTENPLAFAALIVFCTLAAGFLIIFLLGGMSLKRVGLALRCGSKALRDPAFRARVEPLLRGPVPEESTPAKSSAEPLRLLALLQREGRLLDFLQEDIQGYDDAQVGAAVRDIHRQCQAALKEHLVLQQVLPQTEGSSVEVTRGFDPSAIRLIGNVTGQPPFRGTLQHHGWRVKEIKLAPPPEGQDEFVLMPAEVEVQ